MTTCLRPNLQRAAEQRLLVQEVGRWYTKCAAETWRCCRSRDKPDHRRTLESAHSWLLWPFVLWGKERQWVFQHVSLFWEGVLLRFLTTGFTPKSFCFLTISGTIKKTILLICCIYYVSQHTFLIPQNAILKWQNYSDKFTKSYWYQSTSHTVCLKGVDWKPVIRLQ